MNNISRQYINQIKKVFPACGLAERKYIKRISNEINEYYASEPPESIESICDHFGKPEDIVADYYECLSEDDIYLRIAASVLFKRAAMCICVAAFVLAVYFSFYLYYNHFFFKSEIPVIIETVMTEHSVVTR